LMATCAGTKRDGAPCTATVEAPQRFCWWHNPENAAQRRRAASKGGSGRVSGEVRQLRERLKTLTDQVIEGDLETARGAVANQLITTQIKLLEYERRTKDLDDLLERLERLERGRFAG
jgi:septal ring factor EnvC (AmiA/AmiB activator)